MKTFIKLLLLVAMVVPIGLNLAAQEGSDAPSITPEKVTRIITASASVCEGTNTNSNVPINVNRLYNACRGQMIYPAATLGLENGVKIT